MSVTVKEGQLLLLPSREGTKKVKKRAQGLVFVCLICGKVLQTKPISSLIALIS